MSQLTRSALVAKINSFIVENTTGNITATQVNELLRDLSDSFYNLEDDSSDLPLEQVLAAGNETNGFDIIVLPGDKIVFSDNTSLYLDPDDSGTNLLSTQDDFISRVYVTPYQSTLRSEKLSEAYGMYVSADDAFTEMYARDLSIYADMIVSRAAVVAQISDSDTSNYSRFQTDTTGAYWLVQTNEGMAQLNLDPINSMSFGTGMISETDNGRSDLIVNNGYAALSGTYSSGEVSYVDLDYGAVVGYNDPVNDYHARIIHGPAGINLKVESIDSSEMILGHDSFQINVGTAPQFQMFATPSGAGSLLINSDFEVLSMLELTESGIGFQALDTYMSFSETGLYVQRDIQLGGDMLLNTDQSITNGESTVVIGWQYSDFFPNGQLQIGNYDTENYTGSGMTISEYGLWTNMETTIDAALYVQNKIIFSGAPEYLDNAAAVSGGLGTGNLYKTPTGEIRIVI